MDMTTLGAALNGAKSQTESYVESHFVAGSNIIIENNLDGTQTISASGEVSSEDTVARAAIEAIKDGTTIDSFGDVETALTGKVDTESGKGLSENDFTDVLKTKLDEIESGAEVNVQSDWEQTDNTADDYIKGKPTIPTAYTSTPAMDGTGSAGSSTSWAKGDHVHPSDTTKVDKVEGKGLSTNDYTTAEKTKLAGIAEGAEVNVQSNWTQTTTTADDYIKNKPTLGTAAAKNATDTYNATGTDVTTGKAVAAALATLPEPMVFKGSLGTGGTITTLPTASSSNKGYVYKVITAGTYASQSAKVGDTFISDGSAWVLIPSGDEPSGTVTNVAVANGGGLTVSGSPITSSGTITVGHSNSVTAKTSSSVKKFTYDAYGHVTGSSELSTAESDALASGIDSTKVTQIETNKNDILSVQEQANWNSNSGVKNKLNYTGFNNNGNSAGVSPFTTKNVTYKKNADDTISAYTTNAGASGNAFCYLCDDNGAINFKQYFDGKHILSCDVYSANHYVLFYKIDGETSVAVNGDTLLPNRNNITNAYIILQVYSGEIISESTPIVFNPMIRLSSISDSTYQPHAMSNAELTAKEQVNETNILLLGYADNIINTTFDWSDGFIWTNGSINASSQSQFSQPFLLHAGEKITVKTTNKNIGIICSTTADVVSVGDSVTVLQTTSNIVQEEAYSYTATADIRIVICVLKSNYDAYVSQKSSLPLCDWITLQIRSMQST